MMLNRASIAGSYAWVMTGRGVSQVGAVGLALAAYTCWVLTDTCVKYVALWWLPPFEVVGVLGLVMTTALLIYGAVRGSMKLLWPKKPRRQVARALLELGNNVCVVIALKHLALAMFYILIFMAPLITAVGAAAFLRERLGWKQALAIVAGFAGVILAVKPEGVGRDADWVGCAACIGCVACFSTNVVWSRIMTQTERPESLIFISALIQTMVCGTMTLRHAGAINIKVSAALIAAGLCGLLGSLCFFVALKHTSAANVSQYHYSQLVTGSVLAYSFFGERLTATMVMGGALIAGAGLYTAALAYRSAGPQLNSQE